MPTHKTPDVSDSHADQISGRTRSKEKEAKSVQMEPASVTVGRNTSESVSFTAEPDSVFEFPEYHISDKLAYSVSKEKELANQRIDYFTQKNGTDWWNSYSKQKI